MNIRILDLKYSWFYIPTLNQWNLKSQKDVFTYESFTYELCSLAVISYLLIGITLPIIIGITLQMLTCP